MLCFFVYPRISGSDSVKEEGIRGKTVLVFVTLFLIHSGQVGEVGSAKCSESPVVLRGLRGIIQTPNYPHKFDTPTKCKWTIDSTEASFGYDGPNSLKAINVYLTQVNLKEDLTITEYDDQSDRASNRIKHRPKLLSTRVFRSYRRYLDIELELQSPYESHLRMRDYFLDEFGLNITYDIVPQAYPERNDTCSFKSCSFAGKCKASADYQFYSCHCLAGHYGSNCEYNYKTCDPANNITFCTHGQCQNIGSWSGLCFCPKEFTGPKCEYPVEPSVKECPGPDCGKLCSSDENPDRPCSCHNGRIIPQGWVRYEGKLKLADILLSQWDGRNTSKPSEAKELEILRKIESTLAREINRTSSYSVGNVSIISVGPASEFVFQFFGDPKAKNDSFKALANLTATQEIDRGLRLGNGFRFDVQMPLKLKGVFISTKKIIKRGEDFSLTCEAIGSPGIQLKWFKDGVPVDKSLATRSMYEDLVPRSSQDRILSHLSLYHVSKFDRGTYTCQASDMGEDQCSSVFVDVLLPPIIEVEPMSLTLVKNSSAIITCNTINDSYNHSCSYTWYRNDSKVDVSDTGSEFVENLDFPRGSILRIINARVSATYSCVVENSAGQDKGVIRVQVVDSEFSLSCRKEHDPSTKIDWPWTAVGQIALAKCPTNYTGYAQRSCQMYGAQPMWSKCDYSKCISLHLKTINTTLQKLKMGFAVLKSGEDLMELLTTLLLNRSSLYLGEGENFVRVLNDAAKYVEKKGRMEQSYPIFFRAVVQILTFRESCVDPSALITLINLVQYMTKEYSKLLASSAPFYMNSSKLLVEMMRFDDHGRYNPGSYYEFPRRNVEYPSWMDLRIKFPLDAQSSSQFESSGSASLIFIVFRNLAYLLANIPKSYRIVSPIVSLMYTTGYNFHQKSYIHLEYDVSAEVLGELSSNRINLTCGALDMSAEEFRWKKDACLFNGIVNNTVQCHCDTLGQYGNLSRYALLSIRHGENEKDGGDLRFHWSVLVGSILCIILCALPLLLMGIHVQFRIESNSVYLLKMLVCGTIIVSILLIMSLRKDTSSIGISTGLCSLLIVALCCQVTKSLHVLLSTQSEIFPWLRSVSLATLLTAVSFGCLLPTWTAAALLSHSQNVAPESGRVPVLREDSPVFGTFISTVSLIVLAFLALYYKAAVQLRTIRSSDPSDKYDNANYRMKTLNRSLLITMCILLTILATILYGNIIPGVLYQYFYGFSTLLLGMVVCVCYTVKSEYPIPLVVAKYLNPEMLEISDPEAGSNEETGSKRMRNSRRSPGKHLENGQASTSLLEVQGARNSGGACTEGIGSDATLDTFVGSSLSTSLVTSGGSRQGSVIRTFSALNVKRSSVASTSNHVIPRSMTNPAHGSRDRLKSSQISASSCNSGNKGSSIPGIGMAQYPLQCTSCCSSSKKNKSFRSHSSSISSSGGNSSGISDTFKPERGRCLLSEAAHAEYVLPSISAMARLSDTTILPPIFIPSTTTLPAMGTLPPGSSSSGDVFGGAYIESSPQCLNNVNEREISQFLTFQQQQLAAEEKRSKLGHQCHYPHANGNSGSAIRSTHSPLLPGNGKRSSSCSESSDGIFSSTSLLPTIDNDIHEYALTTLPSDGNGIGILEKVPEVSPLPSLKTYYSAKSLAKSETAEEKVLDSVSLGKFAKASPISKNRAGGGSEQVSEEEENARINQDDRSFNGKGDRVNENVTVINEAVPARPVPVSFVEILKQPPTPVLSNNATVNSNLSNLNNGTTQRDLHSSGDKKHKSDVLVRKISQDLDILLDRSKRNEKDCTGDVEL